MIDCEYHIFSDCEAVCLFVKLRTGQNGRSPFRAKPEGLCKAGCQACRGPLGPSQNGPLGPLRNFARGRTGGARFAQSPRVFVKRADRPARPPQVVKAGR